jgi:hypothetical protein
MMIGFLLWLAGACGHGHSEYDDFQDCFDEHIMGEGFPVQQAIIICCLDHDVVGMEAPLCGNSTTDCTSYLGANLSQTSATSDDITAACQEYVNQKNM